jgi:hypothetical protein
MAKAKNSVNAKVAKKAYNTTKDALASMETHMEQLAKHISEMNKEVWSGGSKATSWYNYASKVYANMVKFDSGVTQFQQNLYAVFAKGSPDTGIEF